MGRIVNDVESVVKIEKFPDQTRQANALADRVSRLLDRAVSQTGKATLVVSGGSTPVLFFEALSTRDISWNKVTVTLADERWLPPDHEASNEALVKRHLLKNKAAKACFVGLYTGSDSAEEGQAQCHKQVKEIGLPFDVLILGMGTDGHCASLFPGANGLKEAVELESKRFCVAIKPVSALHDRITLTLSSILSSREIFLLVTGKKKFHVLQKALAPGPLHEMPVRYVLHLSHRPVSVFWAP